MHVVKFPNSFHYNLDVVQSKTLSPFYAVLPFMRWYPYGRILEERLLLQGFTAAAKEPTQISICRKKLPVFQEFASFCWTITTSSQLRVSKSFVCGSPPMSQTVVFLRGVYICRGQWTTSLSITVHCRHILSVFKVFKDSWWEFGKPGFQYRMKENT